MAWIKTIARGDATGRLKNIYDRISGPDGNIDNILMAHSLRPHTLEGHMTLYKYVLHHPRNTLDKWFLEAIGTYVSYLNGCEYCFEHHYHGMARLVDDEVKAKSIRDAIEAGTVESLNNLSEQQRAALTYAKVLTVNPSEMNESAVTKLRDANLDDGEILEINQVVAYFGYANRMVQGLGVSTEGDIMGLSPNDSDDPDNWSHS